jgi:hypothetical protein
LIFHELAVESYHFQQRTGHKMIALRWWKPEQLTPQILLQVSHVMVFAEHLPSLIECYLYSRPKEDFIPFMNFNSYWKTDESIPECPN